MIIQSIRNITKFGIKKILMERVIDKTNFFCWPLKFVFPRVDYNIRTPMLGADEE